MVILGRSQGKGRATRGNARRKLEAGRKIVVDNLNYEVTTEDIKASFLINLLLFFADN